MRRWMVVAGVWAVAATAVALIALLDTSGEDARETAGQAADRAEALGRAQRDLDRRANALESRLDGLAQAGDVARLQDRLGRAERNASQASDTAADADGELSDLEDRIRQLEQQADAAGGASPSPGDRPDRP